MLLAVPLHAQPACDPNGTQMELNECAARDAAKADAELNQAYAKLLSARHGDAAATAKARAAERAWVAYRDAYLEAMFPAADKQAEYGSIYEMQYATLQAKLTRQQTTALRALLTSE